MNFSNIAAYLKISSAIAAVALSIFFVLSAAGYVTETFGFADAACSTCGSTITHWIDGPVFAENYFSFEGGGGGGGYVPPTPPPPAPVCTLDLTQNDITWTTQNAYKVFIEPLTSSPQVPGYTQSQGGPVTAVYHTEAEAYTSTAVKAELLNYGINLPLVQGNTGFAGDQATMNRVCELIDGPGATASTWRAEGYSSPGNNAVVKYTNGAWARIGASAFNNHLRYDFTCQKPGLIQTHPLNGSYTFVPPLGVGTHTYKLTATGTGGVVMCEDTVTIPPPPPPPGECELKITKSVDKSEVQAGEYVEFTLDVKNIGDQKCTGSGVMIVDQLDPGFIYKSETHSANITAGYQSDPVYKASDHTVRFNAWDLDPNETAWAKIKVKAETPSSCTVTLKNKGKVTSYEYNNFSTFVHSNEVSVKVMKDCTPPPTKECKLEISKSASVSQVMAGEYVEYTINFKNIGQKDCTGGGIHITDVLDPLVTYKSETHSSNVVAGYQSDPVYKSSTRTVHFNANTLNPGESGWVKIKVKAETPSACSIEVDNVAKITAYEYDNFTKFETSNNAPVTVKKDCTPTPPPVCTLTSNKSTIAPNEPVTLTWSSTNATTGEWIPSGDNAGTSGSETYTNITANRTFTIKFTGPGGTVECSKKVKVVTPPGECKLEISKSVDDDKVSPGETVEYTITFKNTGGKKCTGSGVKILDVLDERLTYKSESHSDNVTAGYQSDPIYKSSDRTLRWNAWDLDPGESGWVKFKAKVGTPTACTETIPNKAKITSYEYNNFQSYEMSEVVHVTVEKDCSVPAPVCSMSIAPTSILSGQSATLTWDTTNVTEATIDQGVGSVAVDGTKSVSPTANTTYTGTFKGPGGTVTCTAHIVVEVPTPTPACTMTTSATEITTGESVIVSWTSTNVTQGFIPGIGTTTPLFGGSAEVFPSQTTTYVGTFSGQYGTVQCQVQVAVKSGPGGCVGSCGGGGINPPNVVMLQKPPEAPLAFVTLEQIPYTGFAAGKALTLAFWLAVGVLAALITYFVMGRGGVQYALGGTLGLVGFGGNAYEEDERDVMPRAVPTTLNAEEERYDSAAYNGHYTASVAAAPTREAVGVPTSQSVGIVPHVMPMAGATRQVVDGIPDISDVIESRAHAAGVLMSPEAVQMARELSTDRAELLRQFGEILNNAIRTLPREDGWIMLTSEHFEELAGKTPAPAAKKAAVQGFAAAPSVEDILASVMQSPVPEMKVTQNVEMPMAAGDDQAVVMALARAILSGNRDQAYATVRNLESAGANVASVMTVVAGALDQLYRARRHGLTTDLSVAGMNVSDEVLAKMVELFTHGMDGGYSNAFTSLKLAVAQAFEARG